MCPAQVLQARILPMCVRRIHRSQNLLCASLTIDCVTRNSRSEATSHDTTALTADGFAGVRGFGFVRSMLGFLLRLPSDGRKHEDILSVCSHSDAKPNRRL